MPGAGVEWSGDAQMTGTGRPEDEGRHATPNCGSPADGRMPGGPLVFWLVLMAAPLSEILNGRMRPAWPAIAGLVAFCVLYAGTVLAAPRAWIGPAVRYALLAALAAISVWYTLRFGQTAGQALPLLAMAAGAALPLVWPAGVGVAAVTLLSVLIEAPMGDATSVGGVAFGTSTAGTVIVVFRRLFATIAELRATREELAHAAVSRERRRFARDLHDLLGHTLSVIVVKGEIVRRLATRDPEAAAAQAGDIVEIGRAALGEVRQAVSGYRTRGLSAELDDARVALDDAGVEAVVTRGGPPPPAETDLLLGWVVREAVTNVIRHAGARRCRIGVSGDDAAVTVTITDDGHGAPDVPYGNGLTGMMERVTAAGGELRAGTGRRGGFTVTVTVPAEATGTDDGDRTTVVRHAADDAGKGTSG